MVTVNMLRYKANAYTAIVTRFFALLAGSSVTDFSALIVGVHKTSMPSLNSTEATSSDLAIVYLAHHTEEDSSSMGVLRVWGGLEASFCSFVQHCVYCLSVPRISHLQCSIIKSPTNQPSAYPAAELFLFIFPTSN
ncbi:unnamed protein product [Dibothriocephalus latus]|uniref:Uncharacterized protein n=1 Tax=Dibothriocephalus latus TaxID=60516 RepID=A0A3P7P345_DIBLA|nr:unnamed protein product [Dibothriocephalus latus]